MSRREVVKKMHEYKVKYELDENGWWVASVVGIQGCHTQGRSIAQSRKRIREALGLFVKNADDAVFVEDIKLPNEFRPIISSAKAARTKADEEHQRARKFINRAVEVLVAQLNLSRRDAAEILGLSHQRIQQMLDQIG